MLGHGLYRQAQLPLQQVSTDKSPPARCRLIEALALLQYWPDPSAN